MAEADTSQRGNALTALVEACSQAERRGESNAHDGGCQFGGGLEVLAQRAGDADVAQGLNAPEADVVCLLGVHALEEDVEEGRVDAHLFSLRLEGVGGLWGYEPGLYAGPLLVVGNGVNSATVAAVAARILFDSFPEGAAVNVGPEHVHENHLSVGALPQQEVRDALLTGGTQEQVNVGQVGLVQVLLDGLFGNVAGLNLARHSVRCDSSRRVGDFCAAAVVHAHGEGADSVIDGFALAVFELFDDVLPQLGSAASPADAHTPGLEGFQLALQHLGGETHDERNFAG